MRNFVLLLSRSKAVVLLAALLVVHTCANMAFAQATVLHNFVGTDGSFPTAGVVLSSTGDLYGAAAGGGNLAICDGNGCGTVFQIHHNNDGTWSERTIYSFAGAPADGASSYSPLTFDSHGHIFGTTYLGGNGPCNIGQYPGCGTVFELVHNPKGGWTENVLYQFQGGDDGFLPIGKLVFDARGNLYGTTSGGGGTTCLLGTTPFGCGTVFELSPNSDGTWSETVIYRFKGGIDGYEPYGGVVRDAQGILYGTTLAGGFSCNKFSTGIDCGTVYKLRHTSTGWIKSTPHLFTGTDGYSPLGSLTLDASGNLYGVTQEGGISSPSFGDGVVYELTPAGSGKWTETVLYKFTGFLDGAFPTEGVVFDSAGNLYGFTQAGGTSGLNSGGGTLYKLSPGAGGVWTETTIASFETMASGIFPFGQVAIDGAGNLYGATSWDGAVSTHCPSGCGLVFEATP